jgi:hypothetical protein
MSEVISFPTGARYSEMIAKLISAGYLRPDRRHDLDAITKANLANEAGSKDWKWH